MEEPLFKVGDIVNSLDKYHIGLTARNYPHGFEDPMFSQTSLIITSIEKAHVGNNKPLGYTDGYRYSVKNSVYSWSAGMFKECTLLDN